MGTESRYCCSVLQCVIVLQCVAVCYIGHWIKILRHSRTSEALGYVWVSFKIVSACLGLFWECIYWGLHILILLGSRALPYKIKMGLFYKLMCVTPYIHTTSHLCDTFQAQTHVCDTLHSHKLMYVTHYNHTNSLAPRPTTCKLWQHWCTKECVAVCCSVLQSITVCCSVLKCVAASSSSSSIVYMYVCCRVLQCVSVSFSVLQCVAVCCSVLQCVAECCYVLQCLAVSWAVKLRY